jgi:FkbM family methyltransferase
MPPTHRSDRERREGIELEIAALYEAVLLRTPDPKGLKSYAELVEQGRMTFSAVVEKFLHSEEFGRNQRRFAASYFSNGNRFIDDVSQFGEVALLLRKMVNDAAVHRIVVDVGVKGRDGSNTYDLMRWFGWRGILIEANPRLETQIMKEFSGLHVELVSCAVSDYTGNAAFYLGINDAISSLNKHNTEHWGPVTEKIEVPVRRLTDILAERNVPVDFDVLSIDIEGEDIKVINDMIKNSRYRPTWIIVEASYKFKVKSLSDLPFASELKESYELFDQTEANLLLKRRLPESGSTAVIS